MVSLRCARLTGLKISGDTSDGVMNPNFKYLVQILVGRYRGV